jgi:predicted DCC family thiol-disulfide oxidoreductase YuxK
VRGNFGKPLLVFDGDCSFCKIWVGYWQSVTGSRVEYEAYQKAADNFPEIPRSDFQRAVQYFEGDKRYSAAEAVFHLMASVPGGLWNLPLWLYLRLPGFAAITEWLYRMVAAHRNAGYRITRALWGKRVERSTYTTASSLFARAIALIYLVAFISFGRQVRGLIGAQGIQPVVEFLAEVSKQFGTGAFWRAPTVFWWIHSEYGLLSIVWGGAVLAGVAAVGRPHTPGQKGAFVVLFIYYLSIVNGGQIFMGYQWDFLLLEAGFLAIFLKPVFTRVWLFRWLLFRLVFESGAVKLLSHDPTWRNLTALAIHYETQPLPTVLAWYMMQAPLWFQKMSTAFVFAIELGLPLLMFGPRRLKQIAAAGTVTLQILIILTGNYTFFNYLTIALCLFLLDDRLLSPLFKARPNLRMNPRPIKPLRSNRYVSVVLVVFIMVISITELAGMFGVQTPEIANVAVADAASFGMVNQYGLFANMTTSRLEISVEGSNDGVDWQPYVFRYKPGPLNRAPGWVAPDQPRLDWQMWFAALGNYRENPWLLRFMMRLLQGSGPVLELMERNPFAGKPPKYIRAMVYDYHFTNFDERRQTGNWWKRELKGAYFPPISLKEQ